MRKIFSVLFRKFSSCFHGKNSFKMGFYSGKNVRLHMICIVVIFIGTIFFAIHRTDIEVMLHRYFDLHWINWHVNCLVLIGNFEVLFVQVEWQMRKLLHFVDLVLTFYRNLNFIAFCWSRAQILQIFDLYSILFVRQFLIEKKNSKSSNKPMELKYFWN